LIGIVEGRIYGAISTWSVSFEMTLFDDLADGIWYPINIFFAVYFNG